MLNPSIANRPISAWRKYLYESMPVSFRQGAINDPSILIKYVNNNIVLDKEANYPAPHISPKGVDELKVSNSFSRDIYFVALCRSLGIPSRIVRKINVNVPQYYFRGDWHDVWFTGKKKPLQGKGFVRFSSSDKHPAPEQFINFTIAHFKNGFYNPLDTKVDFKDEHALAPGHYMLVTGNRLNDTKILAALSFFELKEDEHKVIDIKLWWWTRDTTRVGLYIAALSGDLANVKRLTQEGSDVDRKDEWGWTALYWAVRGNHKEVAEFLIAKGANVNIKGQKDQTPLLLAVIDNQEEMVEMLIAKGADVNDKDNWNWTALHSAAGNGNKDMVELLIARGANVNARDGGNRTPLWYAQDKGHSEIVELLRKHGGVE